MSVYVHEHDGDYTPYGLSDYRVDLTSNWQRFETEFTTENFTATVYDGRLRFWFVGLAQAGDDYFIDNLVLRKVSAGGPTATPTRVPTPTPTSKIIVLPDTTLSVIPQNLKPFVGETFAVDVAIDAGVNEIIGVELHTAFDRTKISAIDIVPRTFFATPDTTDKVV